MEIKETEYSLRETFSGWLREHLPDLKVEITYMPSRYQCFSRRWKLVLGSEDLPRPKLVIQSPETRTSKNTYREDLFKGGEWNDLEFDVYSEDVFESACNLARHYETKTGRRSVVLKKF